jgi:hypothetical protein
LRSRIDAFPRKEKLHQNLSDYKPSGQNRQIDEALGVCVKILGDPDPDLKVSKNLTGLARRVVEPKNVTHTQKRIPT